MSKRSPLRRFVLGALALAALSGHGLASGCAAGFAPISQIDGLRVLAVSVADDQSYAVLPPCEDGQPCPDTKVTFEMTYVDPQDRPINVVWLAGCFDPPGDAYYACYDQLASLFQGGFDPKKLLGSGLVGLGDTFTLTLPRDLVSRRPEPPAGEPYYGIAYVFFVACAGDLKPVPPEGTSLAGSFPLGCFKDGKRLGADGFVPGYTQVYAFADGRTNKNPVIQGMTLDDQPISEDPGKAPKVDRCPISEEDRLGPPGCGRPDPFKECTTYDLSVVVPEDVADIDPSGVQADGSPLREVVWVDYFTEKGDVSGDARLLSDAVEGYQKEHAVQWIAPPDPGPVRVWAVVHDARGGEAVIERVLDVQ